MVLGELVGAEGAGAGAVGAERPPREAVPDLWRAALVACPRGQAAAWPQLVDVEDDVGAVAEGVRHCLRRQVGVDMDPAPKPGRVMRRPVSRHAVASPRAAEG